MTRELLPFLNSSVDGQGMEGLLNFANTSSNNLFVPLFLFVLYGLAIYVASSKSEYKIGGWIMLISFIFSILSWILQTITPFNQIVIFIFAIGILVGIVISLIESN